MKEYISAINVPQKGICLLKDSEIRIAVDTLSGMLSGELSVQCMSAEYNQQSESLVISQYVSCYPHGGGGGGGNGYVFDSDPSIINNIITLQDGTVMCVTRSSGGGVLTIAAPAGTSNTARDMELIIDCRSVSTPPAVTWESGKFHPRTSNAVDLQCEAQARNVYYISEYQPGLYAVARWKETSAGTSGGST